VGPVGELSVNTRVNNMPKYFYQPGLNKKCEYCGEIYYHSHEFPDIPEIKHGPYIIKTKSQWLMQSMIPITEEEIDNAVNGYIGNKMGINCYITKLIETRSVV